MKNGKFILLEGIDNCGKSTQAKLLVEALRKKRIRVQQLREPGGTAIGEKIREVLLDPANKRMTVATELFLYMASRAQIVDEKIRPYLRKGYTVVCDRYLFSSAAYQGAAGGIGVKRVLDIGTEAVQGILPNLTLILDIDPITAERRARGARDRMERKGLAFQKSVRNGFLEIAKLLGPRARVIDASRSVVDVHRQIMEAVSHDRR